MVVNLCLLCNAQDLTQIGKAKLFTISGGVSANSIFYEGAALRAPFTYVLNGNINFNINGLFNIPLSFAYSNQEFEFSQPFRFNRLSIHPSYKWITAHIGDVAMTFSPYTLSGHQFSGLGLDIAPEGNFKISAMYGRFIRPTEFNFEIPETIPAYKRVGFGLKTAYEFKKASLGLIVFNAKDEINSINNTIPVDLDINPRDNLVVSLEGAIKPFTGAEFKVEYATSAVTENLNTDAFDGSLGPLSFIFNERLSTSYYNAFNANLNFSLGNGSLGAGYERIDPDYNTLGAYFFNNDYENITVNASQNIFNNKLSLSVNGGLQRDNLDKTKKSDLNRVVTAVNANLTASERLTISGSYSSFQSFTNIRSQFDFINAITEYDNIDNLNFKQVSQNATMGIGYVLSKEKTKQQNLSFNLSFQDTEDLQEQAFTGEQSNVNTSLFYNTATSYTLSFPENTFSVSAAFNATLNKIMANNSVALGPTLVLSKQLFSKKVKSSLSSSYNTSTTNGEQQSSVVNLRFNAGYQLLEKHQFNLSALSLFRNTVASNSNDFTVTFGYNYNFSSANKKKPRKEREQVPRSNITEEYYMKIRFRDKIYEGDTQRLVNDIQTIRDNKRYRNMPNTKKAELDQIKRAVLLLNSSNEKAVKNRIIDYLEALQDYIDFFEIYDNTLYKASQVLKEQARFLDESIEKDFVEKRYLIENHKFKGVDPKTITDTTDPDYNDYNKIYANFIEARLKLTTHRWTIEQLNSIKGVKTFEKNDLLIRLKNTLQDKTYELYNNGAKEDKLEAFLVVEMIEYYQKEAKSKIDPTQYILKYINKQD